MNEMWVGKQVARVIFILILPLIGIAFLIYSYRYIQPRPSQWFKTAE